MLQFRTWFIGRMEAAGRKQEGVIWCVQLVPAYGNRQMSVGPADGEEW